MFRDYNAALLRPRLLARWVGLAGQMEEAGLPHEGEPNVAPTFRQLPQRGNQPAGTLIACHLHRGQKHLLQGDPPLCETEQLGSPGALGCCWGCYGGGLLDQQSAKLGPLP